MAESTGPVVNGVLSDEEDESKSDGERIRQRSFDEILQSASPITVIRQLNRILSNQVNYYFQRADGGGDFFEWQSYVRTRSDGDETKEKLETIRRETIELKRKLKAVDDSRLRLVEQGRSSELELKQASETLKREEARRDAIQTALDACRRAIRDERERTPEFEERKATLEQELGDVRSELSRSIDEMTEKVKSSTYQCCQVEKALNAVQREVDLLSRTSVAREMGAKLKAVLEQCAILSRTKTEAETRTFVDDMKSLLVKRSQKHMSETRDHYDELLTLTRNRCAERTRAIKAENEYLKSSLEDLSLTFENLMERRVRNNQRITELQDQLRQLHSDLEVLADEEQTDNDVTNEIDQYYGMVIQVENLVTDELGEDERKKDSTL